MSITRLPEQPPPLWRRAIQTQLQRCRRTRLHAAGRPGSGGCYAKDSTNSNKRSPPVHRLFRLAAVAATTLGLAALAQPYPSKPVKIVVPFAAGGAVDILTRVL